MIIFKKSGVEFDGVFYTLEDIISKCSDSVENENEFVYFDFYLGYTDYSEVLKLEKWRYDFFKKTILGIKNFEFDGYVNKQITEDNFYVYTSDKIQNLKTNNNGGYLKEGYESITTVFYKKMVAGKIKGLTQNQISLYKTTFNL